MYRLPGKRLPKRYRLRRDLLLAPQPPALVQRVPGVHLPRRADQRVTAVQVQPVPGGLHPRVHGVEPQRDLRQLHRRVVEVNPVGVVQGDVRLGLLELTLVVLGVDLHAPLALGQAQVQLGELVHRFVEERPGPQRRLANPPTQHVRRVHPCLLRFLRVDLPLRVESEPQGLLDGGLGQRLGRVVRRAGLPVAAREPVDVRAHRVRRGLLLAGLLVDRPLHEDAVARRVRVAPRGDLAARDQPGPGLRVTALGDLVLHLVHDEPGVGHQALVHGAKVVDAQVGVGNEAAPAVSALALDQGEVAQHLVQHVVAQPQVQHLRTVAGAVAGCGELLPDEPYRHGVEQPRAQRLDPHALLPVVTADFRRFPPIQRITRGDGLGHGMAREDLVEEQRQRVVEVVSAPGPAVRQLLRDHQFPQAADAVSGDVLLALHRQDVELRPGLRVQQEQDPVQVPERLRRQQLGQVAGLLEDVGQPRGKVLDPYLLLPDEVQHLVGDELDRSLQALTQVAGDTDRVVTGFRDEAGDVVLFAVLLGTQRVCSEERGDDVELPGVGTLGALAGQRDVKADSEVPAPGEVLPVGEDHHTAEEQQGIARRIVRAEQPGGEVGDGRQGLAGADADRGGQSARRPAALILPTTAYLIHGSGETASEDNELVLTEGDGHCHRPGWTVDDAQAGSGVVAQGAQQPVVPTGQGRTPFSLGAAVARPGGVGLGVRVRDGGGQFVVFQGSLRLQRL